jgi:hypothetical protein
MVMIEMQDIATLDPPAQLADHFLTNHPTPHGQTHAAGMTAPAVLQSQRQFMHGLGHSFMLMGNIPMQHRAIRLLM